LWTRQSNGKSPKHNLLGVPESNGYPVRLDSQDKRLDTIEDANRARHESIIQRLEQIQQSFAFDKRISNLEDDKRRSA
jgi:hypothetical protein